MAAEIFNIADRRKPPAEKPSLPSLAVSCSEEIAENWERFARNNRLNDYFMQSLPQWTQTGINYLADLNALSVIETKINLALTLRAPGYVDKTQLGWVAEFYVNGTYVSTPFMLSEAYARCFNIMLFLKLSREIKNHGITLS